MMAESRNNSNVVALLNNLLATLLLAALTALGIYVNINKIIVADVSSQGYKVANLDTTYWNVACTIIGTAVGLLTAVAFSNQDDHITRHELASGRGVVAMFLRPLTIMRGVEQVLRLQFAIKRTLLVLLTMVSALTSAAVVALFGIRAVTEEIVNPQASFPLAALNHTFFTMDKDGGVYGAGSPTLASQTSHLSGFLYKAAYITALKIKDDYNPYDVYTPYLPEQGQLVDTLYPAVNTGGVGLNMSSYLQYSGTPDGFNMPAKFEFSKLQASVFGTHVNVSCKNVTSAYTVTPADVDAPGVDVAMVGKPAGPNFTFLSIVGETPHLTLGSAITVDRKTGVPTHTIAVPSFFSSAFVLECTYSGQEYMADVSVVSAVSPLQIERETQSGPLIGPYVQQTLANVTHSLLALGGLGGNLARGFLDADYNAYGDNNTGMADAIETVIGQLGEAYFSVLRQHVERSNIYGAVQDNEASGTELHLFVEVQRLGGGQFGWLAIIGALLIGSLLGTLQICFRRSAVDFDAQDAVKLLQSSMQNQQINDTTRMRYGDGLLLTAATNMSQGSPLVQEVHRSEFSAKVNG
ncbi:hypothetical protein G7Y79_00006g019130 [Physcia stellaris]|nr:hypothetical protein G7Y79_00006g019130 [Physcia stellaris]